MMPFAPWGAAYAGIVALWAVAIAVERRPTLWKGQSLLILNVRFAAITGGVALVRGERPDNALVAFVISIIVVGLLPETLQVAQSPRRALEDVMIVRTLGTLPTGATPSPPAAD